MGRRICKSLARSAPTFAGAGPPEAAAKLAATALETERPADNDDDGARCCRAAPVSQSYNRIIIIAPQRAPLTWPATSAPARWSRFGRSLARSLARSRRPNKPTDKPANKPLFVARAGALKRANSSAHLSRSRWAFPVWGPLARVRPHLRPCVGVCVSGPLRRVADTSGLFATGRQRAVDCLHFVVIGSARLTNTHEFCLLESARLGASATQRAVRV